MLLRSPVAHQLLRLPPQNQSLQGMWNWLLRRVQQIATHSSPADDDEATSKTACSFCESWAAGACCSAEGDCTPAGTEHVALLQSK